MIKIEHLDRLNVCVSESPSTGQTDEPTEDDDCDVDGAEDAELVRLLEEPVLALEGCLGGWVQSVDRPRAK